MQAEEVNELATVTPPLLGVGDLLGGRYRIERYLGGGGMASVYRALHTGLDQAVALKVVSPQVREVPGIVARFMREARAATRLKGEHVVRVFDVGTTDEGTPYLVMELLEGKDLGELIDEGFRPAVEEAIDYALQSCEALAEVHGLGIVHRDLKPANLFITRGPDGLACVKLIDFGISRVDSPLSPKDTVALTAPEVVMGSPRYMPPEQMESAAAADSRSDIWGLGAILYEMLLGRSPFDGDSLIDIYAAAIRSAPEAPSAHRPEIPAGLDEVVLRCLRVDPAERYTDVAELAAALAPFGDDRAAARVAAIARVLETSRARGNGESDAAIGVPGTNASTSRIRRRGTATSRLRIAGFAAGALLLVGVGVAAQPLARALGVSPSVTVTGAEAADPPRQPTAAGPTTAAPPPPVPSPRATAPAPRAARSPAATATPTPTPTTGPTARADEPAATAVTTAAPEPAPLPRAPRADDRNLFEERK